MHVACADAWVKSKFLLKHKVDVFCMAADAPSLYLERRSNPCCDTHQTVSKLRLQSTCTLFKA